jgi:hypothetical protein
LRFWPLQKYPHLIFYVDRSDHIDVWRVLHGQRDIPAWMREPSSLPTQRAQIKHESRVVLVGAIGGQRHT